MLDPSIQHLVIQLHFFATLLMTGVIWFVQLVHYPSFRFIDKGVGIEAAQFHQRRTGILVIPLMLVEIGTAILLMGSSWIMLYGNYLWVNLGLLFAIWGITFLRMVPLHSKLAKEMDDRVINSLISTNWIRTILWTVRAGLLLSFLG